MVSEFIFGARRVVRGGALCALRDLGNKSTYPTLNPQLDLLRVYAFGPLKSRLVFHSALLMGCLWLWVLPA